MEREQFILDEYIKDGEISDYRLAELAFDVELIAEGLLHSEIESIFEPDESIVDENENYLEAYGTEIFTVYEENRGEIKMAKKVYQIPVEFSSWGLIEVEAENIAEAIEKADLAHLPTDADYIDGSFSIEYSGISSFNELTEEEEDELYKIEKKHKY